MHIVNRKWIVVAVMVVICLAISQIVIAQQKKSAASAITIEKSLLMDKIAGGMLGQIIGNLNGLPYELNFSIRRAMCANLFHHCPMVLLATTTRILNGCTSLKWPRQKQ
jgi:hypothetical protein